MITALYVRVSTDHQELSLKAQKERLAAWVKGRPGGCRFYIDIESGRNTERQAFQNMMKAVRRAEIDHIAICKADRLTRNVVDGLEFIDEMETRGVEVMIFDVPQGTTTSDGRFFLTLLLAFAEKEVADQKRRRKDAKWKLVDPDELLKLRKQGLTHAQLGKHFKVSRGTISKRLKELV